MAEALADSKSLPGAKPGSLAEVAWLFLKLGCTSFGGPAVHIALMEEEVVERRRWLSREQFLDLVAATNLIPGPNSTEMAIHVGWHVAGRAGFVVAGLCFILPATLIVAALAWAYVRYGALPEAAGLLYGIKPVVIAVVVQALWRLGMASVRTTFLAAVGLAAVALNLLGIHELLVLAAAGTIVAAGRTMSRRKTPITSPTCLTWLGLPAIPLAQAAAGSAAAAAPFNLWSLFLFFLKVGSVLFGSGYVLLAFLRADLVERQRWLTEQQLLDAVAIGQVTPGPLFTTATFIGYILGGPAGAALATVGIFLPAFFFVALSGYFVPRIRRSPTAGAFLDGVVVGSLALMAVVTWQLAWASLVDIPTVCLAALSVVLVLRYRVNSTWLVLGGGVVGLVLTALR